MARWSSTQGRIERVAPGAERRRDRGGVGAAVEEVQQPVDLHAGHGHAAPGGGRRGRDGVTHRHEARAAALGAVDVVQPATHHHPTGGIGLLRVGPLGQAGYGPAGGVERLDVAEHGELGVGRRTDDHDGEVAALVREHVHLVGVEDARPRHRAGHRPGPGSRTAAVGARHVRHPGVAAQRPSRPTATAVTPGRRRRPRGHSRPAGRPRRCPPPRHHARRGRPRGRLRRSARPRRRRRGAGRARRSNGESGRRPAERRRRGRAGRSGRHRDRARPATPQATRPAAGRAPEGGSRAGARTA